MAHSNYFKRKKKSIAKKEKQKSIVSTNNGGKTFTKYLATIIKISEMKTKKYDFKRNDSEFQKA